MTAQQMIELVLEQTPLTNAGVAKTYLQKALDEFSQYTEMLRRRYEWTLSEASLEHELEIPDLIAIKGIWYHGKKLFNTAAPEYLPDNSGYWTVVQTNGRIPTIEIGRWINGHRQPFEKDEEFQVHYSAYAGPLVPVVEGSPDYTHEPPFPQRWHDTIVTRASEKASFADPERRRYYFTVWRDEARKARAEANRMNTDDEWHVKVYDL